MNMSLSRNLGLQQVYPDPRDDTATAEKEVDIIVMHGLDAQSPKTWIAWVRDDDPNSGDVNWLSDSHMLPAAMPYARILTYDWNANYDITASADGLLGHANTLLDRIYVDRESLKRLDIPLIFVASCFSGILLAKALVRGNTSSDARKRRIVDCVAGVAFLGTPFRGSWETGSNVANLRVLVAMDNESEGGCEPRWEYNKDLIKYLRSGTKDDPSPLDSLVQEFAEMIHQKEFGKVCFYETRDTQFLPYRRKLPERYAAQLDDTGHAIVVTQTSACLDGVDRVGLDVRHNMLHKFNSPDNDGFKRLASRLKAFFEKSRPKVKIITELQTQCIQALHFDGIDYEPGKIREPGGTSCDWLIEHPSYSSWYKNGQGIFWILGHPGSGKSTLIKHAIKSHKQHGLGDSTHILSFFFHNQGSPLQHTIEGLLRGLVRQLVQKFPDQMQSFCNEVVLQKLRSPNDSRWSTPYLMRHFEASLGNVLECFNIRIFVDALNECGSGEEEDDRQEIHELVQRFREIEQRMQNAPRRFSMCLACRHYPQLARLDDQSIDAEGGNGQDINLYVQYELLQEIREDKSLRLELQNAIVDTANGNFQWASLVTAKVVKMYRSGMPNRILKAEVRKIPRKMLQIFESVMRSLPKETLGMSLKLFQWLCFAERVLRLEELQFALKIVPEQRYGSFSQLPNSLWDNADPERMGKLVCTLSGGLAQVKRDDGSACLIHQSVKDYLLGYGFCIMDEKQGTPREVLASGHSLIVESCLWWLTEACMLEAISKWLGSFHARTAATLLAIDVNLDGLKKDLDTSLWTTVDLSEARDAIDAMDPEQRRMIRQHFARESDKAFYDSYSHSDHNIGRSIDDKDWRIVEEILACLVGLTALSQEQPSIPGYHYCRVYWSLHASRSIENGAWDTTKAAINDFLSRINPSHISIYNQRLAILHHAATLQTPLVLRELLGRGADCPLDINSTFGLHSETPLMVAIKEGYINNVRVLLQNENLDVNIGNADQQTALMYAIWQKSLPIVQLLVKHKADIDRQDSRNRTALMYAVESDQYEIVDVLLHKGARMDITDVKGCDVFDNATDTCLKGLARHIIKKVKMQDKEIWGNKMSPD